MLSFHLLILHEICSFLKSLIWKVHEVEGTMVGLLSDIDIDANLACLAKEKKKEENLFLLIFIFQTS